MEVCIFCRIANHKEKAHIIHEEDGVLALLESHPISKGHCLIIPKNHYENIYDITEEALNKISKAAKKVSEILKVKLKAQGVNILHASGKAAQQSIPHFHIHLIPRYKGDDLDTWPKSNYKESNFEDLANVIIS